MIHEEDLRREPVSLQESIAIPSEVHGYSVTIEFMRDWFLSKFGEDYFKTVMVRGKNVLDDYRRFNKEQIIKLELPALSIEATVNDDYDRDTVDLDLGGRDVLLRRSHIDEAFFKDLDHNMFLAVRFKQLEMEFNFTIRVDTRAKQRDLAAFIRKACRVKATQKHFLNIDFHIPTDIMLAIARIRGFEIKDGNIVDIVGFLRYLNGHSFIPIVYKYRCINGKSEFFLKSFNNYAHISCMDNLDLDDGNQKGHLTKEFHVRLHTVTKMVVPDIYYFYSSDLINTTYESVMSSMEALYTYKSIEPDQRNEKGWDQYLSTEWEEPSMHIDTIPFEELLKGGRMLEVIKHVRDMGLSPSIFLDLQFYCNYNRIDVGVDWDNLEIVVNQDMKYYKSYIALYIDKEFYNAQLANINGLTGRVTEDRLNPSGD